MSADEILVAGKALIWFLIPLAIAGWELWKLWDPKSDCDHGDSGNLESEDGE